MPGYPKTSEYTAVGDEEIASPSEDDSYEGLLNGEHKRRHSAWKPRVSCNITGFISILWCTLFTIIATTQCTIWYERRGSNAPRWRPEYSPFYDMMNVQQVSKYMDNNPQPNDTDPTHIYRLPPSPAVDAAWNRIATADGIYPLSEADILRIGKDPSLAVSAPSHWGFPPDKPKMAGIEAFHQLHCLNTLRRGLIINYDYYWGHKVGFSPPTVYARHLNHCVDMLRQHLMCHADLEPFTFNWRVGQKKPYADFEIRKTCVDFEAVVRWQEENKNPRHSELWGELEKPWDALEKEAPAGLPPITNETRFTEGGVPIATLAGLEGKEYCLGTHTDLK